MSLSHAIYLEGLLPPASLPHRATQVTRSFPRPLIGQVHKGSKLSSSTKVFVWMH